MDSLCDRCLHRASNFAGLWRDLLKKLLYLTLKSADPEHFAAQECILRCKE